MLDIDKLCIKTMSLINSSFRVILRAASCPKHMMSRSIATTKKLSSDHDEVLLDTKHHTGIITLNRPKALNALNLNMIRTMHPVLKAWDEDPNIHLVLIKGSGDKAFCAGGDVRAITKDGPPGSDLSKAFFKEEYQLNYEIGTLKTPYVAMITGITMGGGVGLSVHGKYRVASEKTLFAMPETAIGLFPDVGGGYFLPRLQGKLGLYLALTGNRLKGRDIYHAGIATHFVTSKELPYLEDALTHVSNGNNVGDVLDSYHQKSNDTDSRFSLEDKLESINRIFSAATVEEIFQALEKDGTDWATKQLETLKKMSPTSMKVTQRQLEYGGNMNLAEVLEMEYRISQQCMEQNDIYEGIRAVLVDRDNNPKWQPSKIENVTDELVGKYFQKLPEERELNINSKL